MKIKHWQGYGCVDAKKISIQKSHDGTTTLHVKVTGNHECGLIQDDEYDLKNWLIKRFDKNFDSSKKVNIQITPGYENNTETCDYIFTY